MKKPRFLIELINEGKVELVEPSDEMSESYLNKADSHLQAAKILLDSEKLEETVSMAYYAMYHSLLSLFFKCGIKSENHNASIFMLKGLFKETELSNDLSFAKKERIDKQYYVDFSLTKQDSEEMVKKAEDFVVKIKAKIKSLTNDSLENIRKEFEDGE